MGLAEFDVRIFDDRGRLGEPIEMRADTTHPAVGETIEVGDKVYRVAEVHHRTDPTGRVMRSRAVCKCVEVKLHEFVHPPGPPPPPGGQPPAGGTPSGGKLVPFPLLGSSLLGVDEDGEKRVRSVGASDPLSATTVEREVSMSSVERALSVMKTAEYAATPVAIPSNGHVAMTVHDRVQLGGAAAVTDTVIDAEPPAGMRHFVADPGEPGEKPTLRVVFRPGVSPPPAPVTRRLPAPVRTPAPQHRPVGFLLGAGSVLLLIAVAWGVAYSRRPVAAAVAVPVPASATPLPNPAPAAAPAPASALPAAPALALVPAPVAAPSPVRALHLRPAAKARKTNSATNLETNLETKSDSPELDPNLDLDNDELVPLKEGSN